jgi:2-C-methyl-D-erythritol 2,4-cyclodiphosphate synthase
MRVGLGFDVHPFSDDPDRPLVLGGVRFRDAPGLDGHSDADVITHAVAEALLGAAALGDLGEHFPDDDPAWADVDSLVLLGRVVKMIHGAGWKAVNVDCSALLEAPRLALHRAAMQQRLSLVVGADVTVKARRPEGLGALGRGEGIACWAVALVERAEA